MRFVREWLKPAAAGFGLLLLGAGLGGTPSSGAPAAQISPEPIEVTGPYTFRNLAVYLIHGQDLLEDQEILTLQEALEQGKARVNETGNVNRLSVENLSDADVFIHSGDIVKGGRQDRVLAVDLVVPPRSGAVPIEAFCVEQGRWIQRGSEAAGLFSVSDNMVADKALKVAVKSEKDQRAVWSNVERSQVELAAAVGRDSVASEVSASSLQLSLENDHVEQGAEAYVEALREIPKQGEDVIGFAFAVNGRLDSVDIYASASLFQKLWPRLLRASAVQALMESQQQAVEAPGREVVKAALAEAEAGRQSHEQVTDRVRIIKTENSRYLRFDTFDQKQKLRLHRNVLLKN